MGLSATLRAQIILGVGISILLVMATGCSSVRVKYIVEPQDDMAGLMKFRLAGSTISLTVKDKDSKTGYRMDAPQPLLPSDKSLKEIKGLEKMLASPEYVANVNAIVTQTAGSEVLALVVHDPLWQTTALSYSYHDPQLLLLKSVGAEVTDNTKKIIDAAASIATFLVVAGVLGVDGETELLTLPVTVDVPIPVTDTPWTNLTGHKQWWYRIERQNDVNALKIVKKYTPVSRGLASNLGDAVDSVTFCQHYSNDGFRSTNVFPVASCRQITLHVRYSRTSPNNDELGTLQYVRAVADPSRVRTIAIPSKGAISLDPVCGGSVEAKPPSESVWGALDELGKQAKAVKESWDKKKADDKKKKP